MGFSLGLWGRGRWEGEDQLSLHLIQLVMRKVVHAQCRRIIFSKRHFRRIIVQRAGLSTLFGRIIGCWISTNARLRMCVPLQPRLLCDDCSVTSVRGDHVMHCGSGGGRGGGGQWGSLHHEDCPLVSNVSRDRPANHHEAYVDGAKAANLDSNQESSV